MRILVLIILVTLVGCNSSETKNGELLKLLEKNDSLNNVIQNLKYSAKNLIKKKDNNPLSLNQDKENSEFKSSIKIGDLELYEKDFPEVMTWFDAQKACDSMGGGWRLPTKHELNLIFKNKEKLSVRLENKQKWGGYCPISYWSATTAESIGPLDKYVAWYQDFNNGNQNCQYMGSLHYVLIVRSN